MSFKEPQDPSLLPNQMDVAIAQPAKSTVDTRELAGSNDPTTKAGEICVIFATRGRPESLTRIVRSLEEQTRKPDAIILSAVSREDVGALQKAPNISTIFGPPGLAQQRNRALRALAPNVETVVFFDDDFLPQRNWLAAVEHCFHTRPDIACITGHVAADGIKGPGLSFQHAAAAIERCGAHGFDYMIENFSPYGCNMAFRRSAIEGLFFDEKLVLYGWLEDRDFGGALVRRGGKCVKLGKAVGAHLGIKSGRVSGRRLGYSQVVNPIYMYKKGTITTASLADHLFRNITSNLARSFMPEPYVDRFGRLTGNMRAIRDLFTGILAPERAELL